jgi:hypothetical protein
MNREQRNDEILNIARRFLRLRTLESRNSDQLDFHELGVCQIREALEAAYDTGYRAAGGHITENAE